METFVVRIWVPAAGDESSSELHGLVEHVGSGRNRRFAGSAELLSFIEHERRADTRMRDDSKKGSSHEA